MSCVFELETNFILSKDRPITGLVAIFYEALCARLSVATLPLPQRLCPVCSDIHAVSLGKPYYLTGVY